MLVILLSMNLILSEAIPHKRQKRFFPNFFGGYTSTEPSETTVAAVAPKPTYFIPGGPNDQNMAPTFIPAVPISYFTAENGQHFIVVKPVPSDNGPAYSNNIPVVKKSKRPPKKVVSAAHILGLSTSEILELNQLARIIGVKDMYDLPPLEEVMTLLGTTSKSETIKAVRDYASTPGGLELIKDYVLSYQPVKRMDTFAAKNSVEGVADDWAIESNDDFVNFDLNNLEDFNGNMSQSLDENIITPVAEPSFFEKLRSFFTFGYYKEESQTNEPKSSEQKTQMPLVPTKLVPHFIIPVKPIVPIDEKSINSNLQRYPLTPFIQDMNPFAMKPVPIEPSTSTKTASAPPMDMDHNETHIYPDETPQDSANIEDNVSSATKQPQMQIPLPEEANGTVNKILNSADWPKMDSVAIRENSTFEITTEA